MKKCFALSGLVLGLILSYLFWPETKTPTKFSWSSDTTPPAIRTALRLLAAEYPLAENAPAKFVLEFKSIATPQRTVRVVKQNANTVVIEYSDLSSAIRGVGSVLGGIVPDEEQNEFTSVGLMLDSSRNGVFTVDALKGYLRKLALLGFNKVMLYTEDTYQIPGEPDFGRNRGAYSLAELRAIDDYASKLGIEMIPCIQTLGHLEKVLRWPAYQDIADTPRVLLVDNDKTYRLIDKMVLFWSKAFKSRRIHIGMDETFHLGQGKYKELHGENKAYELFNRHLARVLALCDKYNYKPMIWSDMYFNLSSHTKWHIRPECYISKEVAEQIPQGVDLVYWDYFSLTEDFYLGRIKKYRDIHREPIMAGGVRTWSDLWYDRETTEKTMGPMIHASAKGGVKEMFFTSWGDDGAYCDFDSAFAGYAWTAEKMYDPAATAGNLRKRFAAVCHSDYDESTLLGDLQISQSAKWLWDDPIAAPYWNEAREYHPKFWFDMIRYYKTLQPKLEQTRTTTTSGGDLNHARLLLRFLIQRTELRLGLEKACAENDKNSLKTFFADISAIQQTIDQLRESFKIQWLRRFKPVGLNFLDERLVALRHRYDDLAKNIADYVSDRAASSREILTCTTTSAPATLPVN